MLTRSSITATVSLLLAATACAPVASDCRSASRCWVADRCWPVPRENLLGGQGGVLGAGVNMVQEAGHGCAEFQAGFDLFALPLRGDDQLVGCGLDALDFDADFVGGLGHVAGQAADLAGDDGKAPPDGAGSRRLDGGVEGDHFGLGGNVLDQVHHHANLAGQLAQVADFVDSVFVAGGNALQALRGFVHGYDALPGVGLGLVGSRDDLPGRFGDVGR